MRIPAAMRLCAAIAAGLLLCACDGDNPTSPSRAGVFNPSPSPVPSSLDYRGNWEGSTVVDTCAGDGSIEDVICRRLFQPGVTMLMILRLSGSASTPAGTLAFASLDGPANGTVESSGSLSVTGSLSGTVNDGHVTVALTGWNTRLQNDVLAGTFSFRVTSGTFAGTASGTATIRGLARIG